MLAVDSIDLPFSGGLGEQGTQKELAESEKTSRVEDPCSIQCGGSGFALILFV